MAETLCHGPISPRANYAFVSNVTWQPSPGLRGSRSPWSQQSMAYVSVEAWSWRLIFAAASSVFGHPEQTLGIVTLLGGIYRIAERAGRARAFQWALTSEKVSASTMERFGIVNQVVDDAELVSQAVAFTEKAARGPTRAYAAHKTLLRAWAIGGVTAADEAMLDIAMPLFETEDVREGLASAIRALKAGTERPLLDFKGR